MNLIFVPPYGRWPFLSQSTSITSNNNGLEGWFSSVTGWLCETDYKIREGMGRDEMGEEKRKGRRGKRRRRRDGRIGEERNSWTFQLRLSFQTSTRGLYLLVLFLVVRHLPCTSWSFWFLAFNMISRFLVSFWVKTGSPETEKGTMVSPYCSKSITLAGFLGVEKLMPFIRRYMRPRSASNCNTSSFQLRQENIALLMNMARNCWV